MIQIKKALRLSNTNYCKAHLSIVNCILPEKMTPKEIEVVACFMALDGSLEHYRFNSIGRKIVMDKLDISPGGLSNYIKSLLEKGFLVRENKITKILPLLIPEKTEQIYLLKLINTEDGTTEQDTTSREESKGVTT